MKNGLALLALVCAIALSASGAYGTSYTFSSVDGTTKSANADLNDLAHGYYYGWSIANPVANSLGAELSRGATIQSATLVFNNIWNWDAREKDQLNSFLLSAAPPVPGKSEVVPLVIDGIPQGKTAYTYTKTTVTTTKKTNYTGIAPAAPTGYVFTSATQSGKKWTYQYTKTTTSTTSNATGIAPAGYTLAGSKFIPTMVTLGSGIKLSDNLWERSDQENKTDINWGVESFRIQDINGDPANPWDDPAGGSSTDFDLIYELNEQSLNYLFEYALDGEFGIGIDPDCHYYNDGVYFTVVTADAPIPEPSTMLLFGAGLAALFLVRRKQKV